MVAGSAAFGLLWLLGIPVLIAWLTGWSIPTFAMYGIDKRQARAGGWRIPEAMLHALALIGGVIGAWVGRAVFHHKTRQPLFLLVLVIASVLWIAIVVISIVR